MSEFEVTELAEPSFGFITWFKEVFGTWVSMSMAVGAARVVLVNVSRYKVSISFFFLLRDRLLSESALLNWGAIEYVFLMSGS